MLEFRELRVCFHKKKALDGLTMKIEKGSIFGLVGHNGAGKTTALRAAAGLLRPVEGDVLWEGKSLLADGGRRKALVGYVPDAFGSYEKLRVGEYMEFFANTCGLEGLQARRTGQELLDWAGLSDREEEEVNSLPRGMKQRLSLARAMLHGPQVVLIDEFHSGFDSESRQYFYELFQSLQERGVTVVLGAHTLSGLSELCTQVGLIQDGKAVMQGSMEDIRRQLRLKNPLEISVRDRAEEASALLRREPSVKAIAREEKRLFLTVDGGEEEEARLLALIVGAGIPVCSYVRRPGDLDRLFFAMMEEKESVVSSNEEKSGIS